MSRLEIFDGSESKFFPVGKLWVSTTAFRDGQPRPPVFPDNATPASASHYCEPDPRDDGHGTTAQERGANTVRRGGSTSISTRIKRQKEQPLAMANPADDTQDTSQIKAAVTSRMVPEAGATTLLAAWSAPCPVQMSVRLWVDKPVHSQRLILHDGPGHSRSEKTPLRGQPAAP